jgi:hypothetical protein
MVRKHDGGTRPVSGHLDSPTLPELRPEIVQDNLRAAAAMFYAGKLDEIGLFTVADIVARGFADGGLSAPTSELPAAYWRGRHDRPSAAARAVACARVVGCGPAGEGVDANRAAPILLDRWLAAAVAVPGDPEMTEAHARALAANLSQHSSGLVAKIHAHLGAAVELLASPEALQAYGAANLWELVEVVAARHLERAIDVMAMRARAVAGTAALEWLAAHGAAGDLTPDETLSHIAASWAAL